MVVPPCGPCGPATEPRRLAPCARQHGRVPPGLRRAPSAPSRRPAASPALARTPRGPSHSRFRAPSRCLEARRGLEAQPGCSVLSVGDGSGSREWAAEAHRSKELALCASKDDYSK
ncbi:unnamed protein product, partial [Prorocentrum cordatum]